MMHIEPPPKIQAALPVPVSVDEVMRKKTLGAAIELCAELGGFTADKQIAGAMGVADKGQVSRILSGQEGIKWERLKGLMLACGNDAVVLWMAHEMGFDLHSMHKVMSVQERAIARLQEENAALRRVLLGGVRA